ncbi:MAG TPA: hypothetical protein VJB82_01040 [Candidatus Peribacterales bacterium]|nr:hypothetical protein [Candidatus Peribacterales bacterium]
MNPSQPLEQLFDDTNFVSTSAVLSDEVALRLAGGNADVAQRLKERLANFPGNCPQAS